MSSIGEVANTIGAAILVFHSRVPDHFTSRVSLRDPARRPISTFNKAKDWKERTDRGPLDTTAAGRK